LLIDQKSIPCVVQFKKVRAVYFRMKSDQTLYVTAPFQTEKKIETIIRQKSTWILSHHNQLGKQNHIMTKEAVLYLGIPKKLEICLIDQGLSSIYIQDDRFILKTRASSRQEKIIDQFLKNATQTYVEKALPAWIQKTGLIPSQVRFRKMKKWGACTKNGQLIFNSYLIGLPPSLIDYIICHELVHLLHFNHSKKFHDAVINFLPSAKKMEKDLKMYSR